MARPDRRQPGNGGATVPGRDPRRAAPAGEPWRPPASPSADPRRARRAEAQPVTSGGERRLLVALLPLRFFLGGTFLFAGLDKLLSSTFLREGGAGSIARQLEGFTKVSPLAPLIQAVALPHPIVIGGLMALAEIGIGLGVLLGLLYRPAAFMGFLTAMLFFLTASWATSPYYYGPDLPYAAGFLTLALVGRPGPYTAVAAIESWFSSEDPYGLRPVRNQPEFSAERRAFLHTAVLGALAVAVGGAAYVFSHGFGIGLDDGTGSGAGAGLPNGGGGAGAASAPASGGSIGTVSQIQQSGGIQFNDPSSGDPAWAIDVNGKVVAYDATCTHQGCPVDYVASQKQFQCPCHGAVFDATNGAQPISGPAPTPLQPIAVHVDGQGNVILG